MSDKKTPDNKKAGSSRSGNPSPADADESPSPLGNNSFTLAPTDSRTSNPQFGAIGGPTNPAVGTIRRQSSQSGFVLPAPHAQLPFRHATSLANLSTTAANQRTLRTNQPGDSYVTSLPTWRHGPGQAAPAPPAATRGEVRGQGRPEIRQEAPAESREDRLARITEYQKREMKEYQEKLQQQQRNQPGQQQLVPYQGRGGAPREPFRREPFRPMNSKLNPEAAYRPLTDEQKAYRQEKGISEAYLGDAANPANESADIPDEKNCSVWITKLPPRCTYRDLLSAVAVHHPGKIYTSFISPPKQPTTEAEARLPSTGHSAAKIVFYQPWMAQHLIRVADNGQFLVRGYRARAVLNRIKSAPQANDNITTRVLEMVGPAHLLVRRELEHLFRLYFSWDTEDVLTYDWVEPNGVSMRRMEWRFACYRAQAGSAFQTILDYHRGVFVRFFRDPCDVLPPPPPPPQMQQIEYNP